MLTVLICAPEPVASELHQTLLWRDGLERHLASSVAEALPTAVAVRPHLVLVDRELPDAARLVQDLRQEPSTRRTSIAVLTRGAFELDEVGFLDAGANAILRLPVAPDWDQRLGRLLTVPPRRRARLTVHLEFEGRKRPTVERLAGHVLDVSIHGMRVKCAANLSLGTDLDFAIQLPGGTVPVQGCGRVMRFAGPGSSGVEFFALEDDGAVRIAQFVGQP
jgi:CheY-like chemotaxis protein